MDVKKILFNIKSEKANIYASAYPDFEKIIEAARAYHKQTGGE
jgi:hypothetical protein